MNSLVIALVAVLFVGAQAQFEAGHVKILEDQRYQEGARFGNFRNQEDGTVYHEETDEFGVRRGYWQYIGADNQVNRFEFESGPGIGFRILKSNLVKPTPIAKKTPEPTFPGFVPRPAAPRPAPRPAAIPRAPVVAPRPARPVHVQPVHALPRATPQPEPQNLFDYPADLQFFRDHTGHRFRFTAAA